jgi:hypothetical protein
MDSFFYATIRLAVPGARSLGPLVRGDGPRVPIALVRDRTLVPSVPGPRELHLTLDTDGDSMACSSQACAEGLARSRI